jgi:thiol-disulfide isomerase/thioredoxin
MIFKTFDNSNEGIEEINKYMEEGKQVFILIFMHGCGPCNATRPEWNKIKPKLEKKYSNNNNIIVVDVNKDFMDKIKYIGDIDGFPTMKYITNKGNQVENFDDGRTVDSFIKWIESKIKANQKGPNQKGPNQKGPNQKGPNQKGPNQKGPNQKGPNQKGPNQKGGKKSVYDVYKRLSKSKKITKKTKKLRTKRNRKLRKLRKI